MAKITKFLRLGLTPEQLGCIRAEAQQQDISMSELVRTAISRYLEELRERRAAARHAEDQPYPVPLIALPLVCWTRNEEQAAHKVMQQFREEDR